MKKLLILSFFLFGCSDEEVLIAEADPCVGCSDEEVAIVEENPCAEFTAENFSTDGVFTGVPTPANLATHPDAGKFEAEILKNQKQKPNFAGYYEVISWECGENCQRHVVNDLRTGRIIFLGLESRFGADFSTPSRVLTMNPEKNLPSLQKFPEEIMTQYWLMEGGEGDIATEFSLGCEANLRAR